MISACCTCNRCRANQCKHASRTKFPRMFFFDPDEQHPVDFQLYRLQKDLDNFSTKLSMRYYHWNVAASPTNFGDLLELYPSPQFEGFFGCLLPHMPKCGERLHMLVCSDRGIYSWISSVTLPPISNTVDLLLIKNLVSGHPIFVIFWIAPILTYHNRCMVKVDVNPSLGLKNTSSLFETSS